VRHARHAFPPPRARCVVFLDQHDSLFSLFVSSFSLSFFSAFPALNLVVPMGQVVLWMLVIPLSAVRALGATLCYTAVFVLINNTAGPETRGAGTRHMRSIFALFRFRSSFFAFVLFFNSATR
jgi:hypothetical protein